MERNSFLNQLVSLLLEEVAVVDVAGLELEVILLQVGDILDHFFQDVVRGLGSVMLKGGAFAPEQLHLLLIVIEHLVGLFGVALNKCQSFYNLHQERSLCF